MLKYIRSTRPVALVGLWGLWRIRTSIAWQQLVTLSHTKVLVTPLTGQLDYLDYLIPLIPEFCLQLSSPPPALAGHWTGTGMWALRGSTGLCFSAVMSTFTN